MSNTAPVAPQYTQAIPVEQEEIINLSEYLEILMQYKWLTFSCMLFAILLGSIYAFLATPEYSASALIQVEAKQSSGLAALEDVSNLFEGENSTEAEIELIKSRMVLGEAIERTGSDIIVQPRYFPVIGPAIARRYQGAGVAAPLGGLEAYAWGGEQLGISVLSLPHELIGEELTLKIGESGTYELTFNENKILVGRVGELAEAHYSNSSGSNIHGIANSIGTIGSAVQTSSAKSVQNKKIDPNPTLAQLIQIHVDSIRARPNTEFKIAKLPPQISTKALSSQLQVNEKGKKSGMLNLQLQHTDPYKVHTIVNTIASVYVEQNINRNSAEAALSLRFLEQQLPPLKEQLDASENAYNLYRVEKGSVDLQTETLGVLTKLSTIGAQLLEFEQQRNELRKKFTSEHPMISSLDGKIAILKAEEKRLESSTDSLPEKQKDILRLARDVEMNTLLYSKLLNTAQELRVAKAGTVGSVRVIDYALPPLEHVKPRKGLILILSLFLGLIIGVVLSFILKAIRGGVNDPAIIEKKLGLPIYGSLLHSNEQELLNKQEQKSNRGASILAKTAPESLTIEAFKSLRTSLYFSLQQAENNVLMITGSSPGIGKTFTLVNLAAVFAEAGKKVLVIDVDLRRGTLHRFLNKTRDNGLSELITDSSIDPFEQIQKSSIENLSFLTSGALPANPSELLINTRFQEAVNLYRNNFDLIIFDAPPILAVTDAAIVGRSAGTSLLVVKSNTHTVRELEEAAQQFKQAGIVLKGFVFNGVKVFSSGYSRKGYTYRYEYEASV